MRASLKAVLGLVLTASSPLLAADMLATAAGQVAVGDYQAALATLDRMDTASVGAASPLFLRATALAGNGRLDEAALLFERLIAEHPSLPEAYNNLAALRARQGQLAEAKELLERALHTDERYATVYENLSTVYVEMARGSYAKALRLEAGTQPPRLAVLPVLSGAPAQQVAVAAPGPAPAPVAAPAAGPAAAPIVPPVAVAASVAAPLEPVAAPAAAPAPEQGPLVAQPEPIPAPAPVAAAAPVPAAEMEPSAAVVPEPQRLAVVTALNGWARAWSQQNVDAYLAYYDADFAPEGMERRAWEAERRARLGRPAWIKVELEEVQVEAPAPDAAVVSLRQRYAAPGYKDVTLKRMTLTLRDGNWMITAETSLKVQR